MMFRPIFGHFYTLHIYMLILLTFFTHLKMTEDQSKRSLSVILLWNDKTAK